MNVVCSIILLIAVHTTDDAHGISSWWKDFKGMKMYDTEAWSSKSNRGILLFQYIISAWACENHCASSGGKSTSVSVINRWGISEAPYTCGFLGKRHKNAVQVSNHYYYIRGLQQETNGERVRQKLQFQKSHFTYSKLMTFCTFFD